MKLKDLPSYRHGKTVRMPRKNKSEGGISRKREKMQKIVTRTKSINHRHKNKKEVHGYTNSGFIDENNKAIKLYYTNCGDIIRYKLAQNGTVSPYKNAKSVSFRKSDITCDGCLGSGGVKKSIKNWVISRRDKPNK